MGQTASLRARALEVATPRRRFLLTVGASGMVIAAGCAWFASRTFRAGLAAAAAADYRLELVAGLGFVIALAATACSWRLAFRAVGAPVDVRGACATYAVGSLVNTFSPARLGDGVRAALFARSLPSDEGRMLTAAGAVGALGLCRATAHALVLACGSIVVAVPVWPLLGGGGLVASGAAAALVLCRRASHGRLAHLVKAAATLARRPRLGLGLVGWSLVAVLGRFLAAAALASALGIPAPLVSAFVITAAVGLAGLFPVTPGGIGITSGAVSLALAARGSGLPTALAAGLVFHLVETASSLAFAGTTLTLAARPRSPVLKLAAALGAAALVAVVTPAFLDLG